MFETLETRIGASIVGRAEVVYKPILAKNEPEEVMVKRQLECWLEPGWCMSSPAGTEAKADRKGRLLLWIIATVLTLAGLVGVYH